MDNQIEEIASCLIGKNVTGSDSTKVLSLGYLTVKEIASILVNAGYRKIPEGAVVLTREEYENLNLKLFEYEVSISRDYVQQDIFDEVLDEKIAEEIENCFLHERVKALEELVGALKMQIEAYKEQVEALKEFNDVSCKKTRKETVEKFAKSIKAKLAEISTCGLIEEYISVLNGHVNKIAKEITEGEV